MKVGVIGDIHTEDATLERVVGFLRMKNVAAILCTGDIVDGPGDANRCFDILREENALVVAGNHERWLVEDDEIHDWPDATNITDISPTNWEMIISLPAILRIKTPSGPMLLCHGLGKNDMAMLRPFDEGYAIEFNADLQRLLDDNRYRYVVAGHTHIPMLRKFGRMTFINPGTLTFDCRPCFLTIDFNSHILDFFEIDFQNNIRKSQSHSLISGRTLTPDT